MLNVHISYKPPSYWRILFFYEGLPRQFNCLKRVRYLVVHREGFRKGIIHQGSHVKLSFYFVGPVMLDYKRGCNGILCMFA